MTALHSLTSIAIQPLLLYLQMPVLVRSKTSANLESERLPPTISYSEQVSEQTIKGKFITSVTQRTNSSKTRDRSRVQSPYLNHNKLQARRKSKQGTNNG